MAKYVRNRVASVPWPKPFEQNGAHRYYRGQQGWDQRPTVTKEPLEYALMFYSGRSVRYESGWAGINSVVPPTLWQSAVGPGFAPGLMNRALARFKTELGPEASLGTALAEIGESFKLIAGRASQLYRAYKALKKGRFKDFSRALNVRPLPKHKHTKWTRPKDASATWLEYWMGWAPMAGDIHSAMEVVVSDLQPSTIKGTASGLMFDYQYREQWYGSLEHEYAGKAYCKVQADVKVVNPNLWLLSQLGLINPASIAWDLVPFSFMIDWFANIGDCLSEWTAYAGLQITNAFSTRMFRGVTKVTKVANVKWGGGVHEAEYACARMFRTLGLPKVSLQFEIPGTLSKTRAATAIALLVSTFTKG